MKFKLQDEPLICGDEHNTQKTLARTQHLYELLESFQKDVIHLGDIFHTKEQVSSKALNLVYRLLKQSKINHVILVGNHDFHSAECEDHSLRVLNELPNVLVVDTPAVLEIGSSRGLFLPYHRDPTRFEYTLTQFVKMSAPLDILFMHQGVTGFDYGNGHIATNELDSKVVRGFKKVVSGHFHKHQKKGNLWFLGMPYSNDFGESNQDKYLGILKSNLSIELILTDFPKHKTWELSVPCVTPPYWGGPEFKETDIHRIILVGKSEDIKEFPKDQYPGVRFIERPLQIAAPNLLVDKLSNEAKFQLWAKDRLDYETETLGLEILVGVKP